MGQKINPFSFRLGFNKPWQARWFPKGGYKNYLEEDEVIRDVIESKIALAGIVSIEIERSGNNAYRVTTKVARPGFVIGRGGKGVEELSKIIELKLKALLKKRGVLRPTVNLTLNIDELKRSEMSAQYVADQIAWDLEKRIRARRMLKKYIEQAMENRDVKGVKIKLSGRIDGAEIARREWLAKGSLPLQTLRANIDYAEGTAFTGFGTVGIKVWLYKGEVFEKK